jgi:amino acid transporter/nucleotide-binding universal stress UspA family protein
MPTAVGPSGSSQSASRRIAQVIIVGSVMFTFISYWRTAAVVLCDLASTAYYIGGIVEQAIGPAAPWFILAVMLFSYAVRSVYIESCSLFVRGGVYRVVKEAMGGFLAKLSVSALMFDYILTGPTSGVSAGQYIMGLGIDFLARYFPSLHADLGLSSDVIVDLVKRWGSVVIACAVTLYFYRQNLLGIHESSGKALKIMVLTTVMAVVMLVWCGLTLAVRGPANPMPSATPDLTPKVEYDTEEVKVDRVTKEELETPRSVWQRTEDGRLKPKLDENGQPVPRKNEVTDEQEDPLGLLPRLAPTLADKLRDPSNWLPLIGVIGVLIAFGHSILAMSGEETLAQVYREVESPKLANFKKAAFIVFVYSLLLTASISFLAVLLIPDEVRMKDYSGNLIGGLAMYVLGPDWARLSLNGFVVVVGFLILAGAVNTAIIGSNGVLNRVAEDGVLPDWFLKPHSRYGTTSRLLKLIVILQLFTIIVSRGHMDFLGEAYAFGVVWSFVFKAMAMVVLRFKDRSPREFKVPFNIRIGGVEFPIGLSVIFLILLTTAVLNFFTKEVATYGGLAFTAVFLVIFMSSEYYHERRRRGSKHEHLEQFNQQTTDEVSPVALRLHKPYRKLVAIRSPQNLYMLEKTLAETDPATTDVVVMTAKVSPMGDTPVAGPDLDEYDQHLMTAVVTRAERAGKEVTPLILPTNNPLFAVIRTAKDLQAQELVMGASNKYTADEQLEQIAFYWINMHDGRPTPLTVRILGRDRDVHLDLAGGNRIPRISERKARSVAELRAAGVGVDRVLLVHDGSPESSDLFQSVLTMLDSQVALACAAVDSKPNKMANGIDLLQQDQERAKQLGREFQVLTFSGDPGPEIVRLARAGQYDLIILPLPSEPPAGQIQPLDDRSGYIMRHAHCRVFLASPPAIPQEVEQ